MTVTLNTELQTELCIDCGVLFAMTAEFRRARIDDRRNFYCPSGHAQHYLVKPLRDQLAEAQRREASAQEDARVQAARANAAEQARAKAEREAKRLLTRSTGGVCPCCSRSFVQLARHMKSKHPDVTS